MAKHALFAELVTPTSPGGYVLTPPVPSPRPLGATTYAVTKASAANLYVRFDALPPGAAVPALGSAETFAVCAAGSYVQLDGSGVGTVPYPDTSSCGGDGPVLLVGGVFGGATTVLDVVSPASGSKKHALASELYLRIPESYWPTVANQSALYDLGDGRLMTLTFQVTTAATRILAYNGVNNTNKYQTYSSGDITGGRAIWLGATVDSGANPNSGAGTTIAPPLRCTDANSNYLGTEVSLRDTTVQAFMPSLAPRPAGQHLFFTEIPDFDAVRLTTSAAYALLTNSPGLRLTESAAEVLLTNSPGLRLTESAAEVLLTNTPGLRVTESATHVLVSTT